MNMKNILISVATATLLSGLAVSSAMAAVDPANLCFDNNTSNTDLSLDISVDKASGVTLSDHNLTLVPQGDYQGASFKLKFTNGGIPKDDDVIMCVGIQKVGSIQEPGNNENGILTEPTFSFIDQKLPDGNITFRVAGTNDCNGSSALKISAYGEACNDVTAVITDGKSTQGERIPSLDTTTTAKFGKTATKIKIACVAPECFLQADKKNFSDNPAVKGINVALTSVGTTTPDHVKMVSDCQSGDCGNAATTTSTCTTWIQIENKNDFNITGLDLKVDFDNGNPNLGNILVALDNNNSSDKNISTNYTLGNKVSVSDINISKDSNATLKLVFTTNGTSEVQTGNFLATINGMDSNEGTDDISKEFTSEKVSTIKQSGLTEFTVPYMYNAGTVSNFVKISTILGNSEADLSAVISDNKGNSCSVTLRTIPGNGGSTYVWANGTDNPDRNYQPLIPAGECSNLDGNQYSVKFTTNASVNVVSYMRTRNGERVVIPF
jgi:hypothetical protein